MSNNDLKLEPHNIDNTAWWYEEPDGIHVVVELRRVNGDYAGTTATKIPWASLRSALKRKDRRGR